jgi:hypothetical protein
MWYVHAGNSVVTVQAQEIAILTIDTGTSCRSSAKME